MAVEKLCGDTASLAACDGYAESAAAEIVSPVSGVGFVKIVSADVTLVTVFPVHEGKRP